MERIAVIDFETTGISPNMGCRASEIAVVMLDVLDCGDPDNVAKRLALYTSYGFAPLPSNGLRLFLPMATVRMLIMPGAS